MQASVLPTRARTQTRTAVQPTLRRESEGSLGIELILIGLDEGGILTAGAFTLTQGVFPTSGSLVPAKRHTGTWPEPRH